MNILSIDLASKNYADNGIILLQRNHRRPENIDPESLGLSGTPATHEYASAIACFADEHSVQVIFLDGPQGWQSQTSPIQHMRLCERVLNTPGKTGTYGTTKPSTYLGFIRFSISIFATLRSEHRFHLMDMRWDQTPKKRWIVESFPTAAWKTLGLEPLPAKTKTTVQQLTQKRDQLSHVSGLEIPKDTNHDQLQALVAALAGIAIVDQDPRKILLVGVDPWIDTDGNVIEGLIALPHLAGGIPFLQN